MSEYSGICAAAAMSDGFVVASCGLNSLMALKSPVSETTVVMLRSCSSTTFAMMNSPVFSFYPRSETVGIPGSCAPSGQVQRNIFQIGIDENRHGEGGGLSTAVAGGGPYLQQISSLPYSSEDRGECLGSADAISRTS